MKQSISTTALGSSSVSTTKSSIHPRPMARQRTLTAVTNFSAFTTLFLRPVHQPHILHHGGTSDRLTIREHWSHAPRPPRAVALIMIVPDLTDTRPQSGRENNDRMRRRRSMVLNPSDRYVCLISRLLCAASPTYHMPPPIFAPGWPIDMK